MYWKAQTMATPLFDSSRRGDPYRSDPTSQTRILHLFISHVDTKGLRCDVECDYRKRGTPDDGSSAATEESIRKLFPRKPKKEKERKKEKRKEQIWESG
jgi:hypothetical protein